MDPISGTGTVTVEYYDESSDFSESDEDESEHPTPTEQSPSCSPCSSSSVQNIRNSVSFKTYDFKHVSESDNNNEFEQGIPPNSLTKFSGMAREAMKSHFLITHQEHQQSLISPRASVLRCPRGDIPEQYYRRKHPGPFLTCPFNHSHECGDEFLKIQIPTKPTPEYDTFTRPQHLKEKKAKFFKQCKNCETVGFTHYRNPAQHYEDYLNNVTYKQHGDHAKVWQQHVVDLMFMLGEDPITYSEEIVDECKHYRPSEAIVKTIRHSRNTPRRIPTVVSRKRTPIIRPLRRPLTKTNASQVIRPVNSTRGRVNQQKEDVMSDTDDNQKNTPQEENYYSFRPKSRSAMSVRKSNEMHYMQSIRRRSQSQSNGIDDIKGRSKSDTLNKTIKASVTRLIKSRQGTSNDTKQFVKKPEPSKEVKYIQKGKPNISAKFLRAKSKNKFSSSVTPRSHLVSPTTSRSLNNRDSRIKVIKMTKHLPIKSARSLEKPYSPHKTRITDDSSEEGDGSYAKYRDQNGEFDVEKYRQSILKMLSSTNVTSDSTQDKKKKAKRMSNSNQGSFSNLPKIKNVYSNVKPRITSNFTQRKRRKVRKQKNDSELDFPVSSEVSLRAKYWNEDNLDSKDSYFSIPGVDNF